MDAYGYNGNMSQSAYNRAFNNQQQVMPNMQQLPHVEVSGCCCQASPVTLRLMNAGVAATDAHVNISVLKVR